MELDYYNLYLRDYVRKNHPERISEVEFIQIRAEQASTMYEQSRLNGYTPEGAQEIAMAVLLEGLHFSKYNTIIDVLRNEFMDEPSNALALALIQQPEVEEMFARYPLTDNFAYTPEYNLLYTELTGFVATYLEEYGV